MRAANSSGWTDALEAEAIALFKDGMSASQIAGKLYPKGLRASRNAVVGLLNRRGIFRGAPTGETKTTRSQAQRREASHQAAAARVRQRPKAVVASPPKPAATMRPAPPTPKPPRPVAVAPTTAAAIPLFRLTRSTCRFPVGPDTGAEQLFCGAASAAGKPYCPHHARIAGAGRVSLAA